jgi:hypothetical protein
MGSEIGIIVMVLIFVLCESGISWLNRAAATGW